MLTTGEWCNPVNNMLYRVKKGAKSGNWEGAKSGKKGCKKWKKGCEWELGIGRERFENCGSVLGWDPAVSLA